MYHWSFFFSFSRFNSLNYYFLFLFIKQIRRKERNEAHLYMTVNVLLEDAFDGHQGNDLYDPEKANYRVFRIKKQATVQELLQILAENFNYKIAQIRPWPFSARTNHVSVN